MESENEKHQSGFCCLLCFGRNMYWIMSRFYNCRKDDPIANST